MIGVTEEVFLLHGIGFIRRNKRDDREVISRIWFGASSMR